MPADLTPDNRRDWPVTADLTALAQHYLNQRGHIPSTAGMAGWAQVLAQAAYVHGETHELIEAADHGDRTAVQHELADVIISATILAWALDTTPEECIALKTLADSGRG